MPCSTPASGSCIDLPLAWTAFRPTVFLDLFQIGNRRSALVRDDLHFVYPIDREIRRSRTRAMAGRWSSSLR